MAARWCDGPSDATRGRPRRAAGRWRRKWSPPGPRDPRGCAGARSPPRRRGSGPPRRLRRPTPSRGTRRRRWQARAPGPARRRSSPRTPRVRPARRAPSCRGRTRPAGPARTPHRQGRRAPRPPSRRRRPASRSRAVHASGSLQSGSGPPRPQDTRCIVEYLAMQQTHGLKAALKRGALIAAANWPLVIVGFVADSSVKLLLAVPIVGGAFLVALLLDTPLTELLRGDVREIIASVVGALRASPPALGGFGAGTALVFVIGWMLQFIVKGGTVALLADAERVAGPIEKPPLLLEPLRRAYVVSIDAFLAGCARLWRRYVRIGIGLLLVYALTAAVYLAFIFGGHALAGNSADLPR